MTSEQRRRFLIKLVPAIPHLPVDQFDLGCFVDPKYAHEIVAENLTPV